MYGNVCPAEPLPRFVVARAVSVAEPRIELKLLAHV